MFNKLDFESIDKQTIKKYNQRINVYNLIGVVVFGIILFVQKTIAVRLLTLFTLIVIHFMMKSLDKLSYTTVKCIKKREYRVLGTEITDFEYINQDVDAYRPSRTLKYINFKDTELLYEINKCERKFSIGDHVVLQIIECEGKEYIVNILKLN